MKAPQGIPKQDATHQEVQTPNTVLGQTTLLGNVSGDDTTANYSREPQSRVIDDLSQVPGYESIWRDHTAWWRWSSSQPQNRPWHNWLQGQRYQAIWDSWRDGRWN